MFLVRGCTFSACRYDGKIISRAKLFESNYPSSLNLDRFVSPVFRLFNTERNLSTSEESIKKYLHRLVSVYQTESEKNDSVSEILKLRKIPLLLEERIKIIDNINNLIDLVSNNEEMKELAKEEEVMYKEQLQQNDVQILDTILQSLGSVSYDNIIMEIVPGVGGQEAMLFAKDLFHMYINYFDRLGLNYEIVELLESDISGLRKATILVSDSTAYNKLKYEGGVHRVQRTPATEKSGRLHTSTAVVTISPEPRDIDVKIEEKDLKIESMKASGAGGQHVNSTNSAIRITHLPTGKAVTCQTDRSQLKNKNIALMKLRSILYEEQLNTQTSFISELRKKQMGLRSRNEKIRTYNFNQDRITDHRISNGTMHNLKELLRTGTGLEELQEKVYKDLQEKTLLEIIEKEMSITQLK